MASVTPPDSRDSSHSPAKVALLVGKPDLVSRLLTMARVDFTQVEDVEQALKSAAQLPVRIVIGDLPMLTSEKVDAFIHLKATLKCDVILLFDRASPEVLRVAAAAGLISLNSAELNTLQAFPLLLRIIQLHTAAAALREQVDGLITRIQRSSQIDLATGIVMTQLNVSKQRAFEAIRRQARSLRLPMEQIAQSIVKSADEGGVLLEKLRGAQEVGASAARDHASSC